MSGDGRLGAAAGPDDDPGGSVPLDGPPAARTAERRRARRSLLLLGALFLVLAALVSQRQWLQDQWVRLTFDPDHAVAQLAEAAGMTEEGRQVYLLAQPRIVAAEALAEACGDAAEDAITLGCFSFAGEIILLSPLDTPEWYPLPVTAAHEMLHAAWQRTDPERRRALSALLQAEFEALAEGHPLRERMTVYSAAAPELEHEELYAVLATEAGFPLHPELEAEFARYLDDRIALAALGEGLVP